MIRRRRQIRRKITQLSSYSGCTVGNVSTMGLRHARSWRNALMLQWVTVSIYRKWSEVIINKYLGAFMGGDGSCRRENDDGEFFWDWVQAFEEFKVVEGEDLGRGCACSVHLRGASESTWGAGFAGQRYRIAWMPVLIESASPGMRCEVIETEVGP